MGAATVMHVLKNVKSMLSSYNHHPLPHHKTKDVSTKGFNIQMGLLTSVILYCQHTKCIVTPYKNFPGLPMNFHFMFETSSTF